MLFRIMSAVADFKYLATMPLLIVRTMVAYAVQRARELEPHQYAWSPENLGMTFTKNRTSAESMVAEMEMNQHFGKTLVTHFHDIKFGSKTQYNFICSRFRHLALTPPAQHATFTYKHAYTCWRLAGHTNMHILQLLTY